MSEKEKDKGMVQGTHVERVDTTIASATLIPSSGAWARQEPEKRSISVYVETRRSRSHPQTLRTAPRRYDAQSARLVFSGVQSQSMADFTNAIFGEHSGYLRMVVSYWDMAAALVNDGAISLDLFNDTNGEHIGVFRDSSRCWRNPRRLWTAIRRQPGKVD